MKKITLLVLSLLISGICFGQQILSLSTDNTTVISGGVACAAQGPPSSTSDNVFSRSYTPSDFGFTGDFYVMGARFIPVFTEGSVDATAVYTVRISTTDAPYPTGTLTTIGETTLIVSTAESGIVQEVMLDAIATVDASSVLVVEIDVPDDIDPVIYDARIGVNSAGEGAFSYISSVACGLGTPVTFASINFPDNHIILDLIGDDTLSIGNDTTIANNISLYPNPTSGDLNIDFATNLGATNVNIIGLTGQKVISTSMTGFGNNTINTKELANGVYFLKVTSEIGSATMKFIKN